MNPTTDPNFKNHKQERQKYSLENQCGRPETENIVKENFVFLVLKNHLSIFLRSAHKYS